MVKKIMISLILILFISSTESPALERAYNPWPPDGSTGVSIYTDLVWDHNGDSSSLYFGTDPDRLYRLLSRSTSKRYDFYDSLDLHERYFWRIDVHEGDSTVPGALWTFRTRPSSVGVVVGCSTAGQMDISFFIFLLPLFFLRQK